MGELVRVAHGLWRRPDDMADLAAQCAAILQVMPPGTVIGGISAAALHGLWLPESMHSRVELIVRRDMARPRQLAGSRRREVRARRRTLHPGEIVLRDGLPLTSLARTWCDLAETMPMPDLVAAGDCCARAAICPPYRRFSRGRSTGAVS